MQMRRVPQGLKLGGTLVECRVIDGSSAGPSKGQVSQRKAAEVSDFAVVRKEERARGFGRHCFMSVAAKIEE